MKKKSTKASRPAKAARKPDPNRYPKGWNRKRVQAVIAHYENQTDDQAIAEDQAAYHTPGSTMMQIPTALVPAVRKLLAKKVG
jgi:hypothetical protein